MSGEVERTYSSEGRKCPYCGHVGHVEAEDYSDSERVDECDECEKKFYAYDEFSVAHIARPDCLLNEQQHTYEIRTHGESRYWVCEVCEHFTRQSPHPEPPK